MNMPLQGINVLEWAVWMSGPVAASCLGDLGAEVVKIEQIGSGDPMRGLFGGPGGLFTLADGRHANFEAYNRNKRSIAIDLKNEKGKQLAHRLVRWADVFIHNFPRETASKLSMDYQTLSRINPRIIYATASSYGREGPDSDLRSFDVAGMARSGHMALLADSEGGEPRSGVEGIADQISAITLSHGILAALFARERSGVAQEIDVSLLGSMIYLQHYMVSNSLFFNKQRQMLPRSKANNPLFNWYKCKDGKWIVILALQADLYWPDFCRALGILELEKDPRYEDMLKRLSNTEELIRVLEKVFVTKTRNEWIGILRAKNIPYCPVNSLLDLVSDPQVLENNYIVDFNHPSLGPVKLTGFPVWFSKTPASVRREAPQYGQQTEEVLQEVLGLSLEEIGRLKNEGVL